MRHSLANIPNHVVHSKSEYSTEYSMSSQSPDASGHVGMAEFLTYPFNSFILTLDRFKLLASCGVSHHVTLVLWAISIGHGMGRFTWVCVYALFDAKALKLKEFSPRFHK